MSRPGTLTEHSAALLRLIAANGPMSAARARVAAPQYSSRICRTLANLCRVGYLEAPPVQPGNPPGRVYSLTARGRWWIAAPEQSHMTRGRRADAVLPPNDAPAAPARAAAPAPAAPPPSPPPPPRPAPEKWVGTIVKPPSFRPTGAYQPLELRPPTRPGAMDAYALPSRRADGLHFPGSRR